MNWLAKDCYTRGLTSKRIIITAVLVSYPIVSRSSMPALLVVEDKGKFHGRNVMVEET